MLLLPPVTFARPCRPCACRRQKRQQSRATGPDDSHSSSTHSQDASGGSTSVPRSDTDQRDTDRRTVPEPEPRGLGARVTQLRARMASYGVAGVAAYGIFNTLYYITAVCTFWFFVPTGDAATLSAASGTEKLAKVFAATWVLSQATKLPRVAASLVFAPIVDRLLAFIAPSTPGKSKQQALVVVTAVCFLTAAIVGAALVLTD